VKEQYEVLVAYWELLAAKQRVSYSLVVSQIMFDLIDEMRWYEDILDELYA